jgi:mRNA-degrading endonuclease RelE of RelBE toxin-antitoxin system
MKRRAGRGPDTNHAKLWRAMRATVQDALGEPDVAITKDTTLQDDLRGVLRIKMGRHRIFYLCNRERTVILFIGWRKEGAADDAYNEAKRLIKAGKFDPQFAELEVPFPPCR